MLFIASCCISSGLSSSMTQQQQQQQQYSHAAGQLQHGTHQPKSNLSHYPDGNMDALTAVALARAQASLREENEMTMSDVKRLLQQQQDYRPASGYPTMHPGTTSGYYAPELMRAAPLPAQHQVYNTSKSLDVTLPQMQHQAAAMGEASEEELAYGQAPVPPHLYAAASRIPDSSASSSTSTVPQEEPIRLKPGYSTDGRRRIKIEYIQDKTRRHITFSKRKAGIMKKAYEISTLTGTQVLLLIASETGSVFTFATPKLQPLITEDEGKHLIQACLNAADEDEEQVVPEDAQEYEEADVLYGQRMPAQVFTPGVQSSSNHEYGYDEDEEQTLLDDDDHIQTRKRHRA